MLENIFACSWFSSSNRLLFKEADCFCGPELRGHMIKRLVQQRAEKTTRLITGKNFFSPSALAWSSFRTALSALELRTRTGIFMVRDDLFCFFVPSLVLPIFCSLFFFLGGGGRIHSPSFQDGFLSLNGCHSLIVTYYLLKKSVPSLDSRCLTQTYRLDFDRSIHWSCVQHTGATTWNTEDVDQKSSIRHVL